MNVNLVPESAAIIDRQVGSGMYSSANEVILEGLRCLEARDKSTYETFLATRRQLLESMASVERGEFLEADEAKARISARFGAGFVEE